MSAWGKKTDTATLPLHEHMLDVAECFREVISIPVFRSRFEAAFGGPVDRVTEQRLLVMAALHDVGKLCDSFQDGRGGHSQEEGWQAVIHRGEALGIDPRSFFSPPMNELAAIFSHHGTPNNFKAADVNRTPKDIFRRGDFCANAAQISDRLREAYPDAWSGNAPSRNLPPAAQHLFAGLLTIADQIGSGEARFPVDRQPDFEREAGDAVRAVGLDPERTFRRTGVSAPAAFGWPEGAGLSDVQRIVADLPLDDRLLLVESETGSGKTEAALLRFFALLDAGRVGSLYFAVPTRSAASQIQGRVDAAVRRMYGAEAALAVPGYLRYGAEEGRKSGPFDVVWGESGRPDESRWAADAPRKFLAAPVAVGTVDQVLMAGLKRKWAHMRGAALSRSLLVVDEVHASDAYMTGILSSVLRDHLAVGGHAMLLSATMGSDARDAILKEVDRPRPEPGPAHYPCVWSFRESAAALSDALAPGPDKRVRIETGPGLDQNGLVALRALSAARAGARVLVIRNSVRGAADVADALLAVDPDAPLLRIGAVPAIHHSRFPAPDRKTLDAAVETALGKGSSSGRGVIVIGTQTLEQSLDIDADLLISDPCPIDVLLQRIGRLHRHARSDRPEGFREATCVILGTGGISPRRLQRHGIGPDRAYSSLTMIRATEDLLERRTWSIPSDNRDLVEYGTTQASLERVASRHDLGKDVTALTGRRLADGRIARRNFLDRREGLHGAEEWPGDALITSRLGDMPQAALFDREVVSAFGNRVREILVPLWMTGKATDGPDESTTAVQGDGFFLFDFKGRRYICDRSGLRIVDD